MGRLDGKVAIVTGGSGGIGSAAARAFVAAGARVMLTDIVDGPGQAVAGALGAAAAFSHHDATREADWTRVLDATVARFGRLDVLVNAVGSSTPGPIEMETYEHWQRMLRLNADTAFLGCRHAIPVLARSGGGSIVNFASTMAVRPRPETTAYSASKAAVRALTQSAALRCGELRNGVRVNCLVPGAIETEMATTMIDGLIANGVFADRAAGLAAYAAAHPIGRIGQPQDVANLLVFLASEESSFITGASIAIDGGYSAG